MEAHDRSFAFLQEHSYYDIPFFQRAYVWNEDNWSELLDDLTKEGHSHFLGSIILKKQFASSSDATKRYDVIDGQQRLTTLSILLRATYDNIIEFHSEKYNDDDTLSKCENTMSSILFVHEGGIKKTRHIKINHSRLDRTAYEEIVTGKISKQEEWGKYVPGSAPEHTNTIIKAYAYFRERLSLITDDTTLDQLWNILSEDRIKFLVNIYLDTHDNEQAIFDTVNSAGVRLTSADTIKNSLFQNYVETLRKNHDSDVESKAIKLYNETWETAFLESEEADEYWGELRQYGRLKRSNLETLLYSFAVIKSFFNPSDDSMSELPQKYKDHVEHYSEYELRGFLIELRDYASIYREYFGSERVLINYYDYPGRIMCVFGALEIATFYPYLLQQFYLFEHHEIDKETLDACLFALERYVVINAICRGSNKNYNNECKQLIDEKKSANELFSDCISINNEAFEWGIRRLTTTKLPTLILFLIELYNVNIDKNSEKALKYEYSLEYVMPKKWEKNWQEVPSYDTLGNPINPESKDDVYINRNQAIYELGNLTLLDEKLSPSVSVSSFRQKVEGINGKLGIRGNGDLCISDDIVEKTSWTEIDIRNRTRSLVDTIRRIWSFD